MDSPDRPLTRLAGRAAADARPTGPDAAVPIRVFLLDDHEIVRRGLTELLNAHPRIEVVGRPVRRPKLCVGSPAARPDVALLDARLPDGSGIDVCREIRSRLPAVRCLILTSYDDDDALFAAVTAGASGYLLKQIRGASLTDAVQQVAAGRSLIDPALTERLLQRLRRPPSPALPTGPRLTPREQRILGLIAEGLTNRQIGETLFIAEKTVKNHVSALLAKLGMQRRTQAAVYGAQRSAHRRGTAGPG